MSFGPVGVETRRFLSDGVVADVIDLISSTEVRARPIQSACEPDDDTPEEISIDVQDEENEDPYV